MNSPQQLNSWNYRYYPLLKLMSRFILRQMIKYLTFASTLEHDLVVLFISTNREQRLG
jgi:hypothetical protein